MSPEQQREVIRKMVELVRARAITGPGDVDELLRAATDLEHVANGGELPHSRLEELVALFTPWRK